MTPKNIYVILPYSNCGDDVSEYAEYTTGFFLPRDASAERGNATVSRPSVTLMYDFHIGWNSWKTISQPNSLGSGAKGTHPKLG